MNSIKFLYAAYIATWVIHGLYLGSLARRYQRLRRQMRELAKDGK
jgi:CcmD family protein